MKKTAVKALQQATGAFLIVFQHEVEVLDSLPLWFHRLFAALVRCSDFKTGHGDCTYERLANLMTPIQPRQGVQHFAPDLQAIKKAVRTLEDRRILARDKRYSQAQGRLIFDLLPRYAQARPKSQFEPLIRTPVDSGKASIDAAHIDAGSPIRTPNSNPSSTVNSFHIKEEKLSTCGQVETRGSARLGGKIGPPRGADMSPASPGTPPRESAAVKAMKAALKKKKIDPPWGVIDAPQESALSVALGQLNGRKKTVLKGEAGEFQSGTGPATHCRAWQDTRAALQNEIGEGHVPH